MKIKKAFLDILLDIREQEYENLSMTDIREEVDTFMFEVRLIMNKVLYLKKYFYITFKILFSDIISS